MFSKFPMRVIAGMICFSAFFGVAIGLGTWLPNIMNEKGFTITKSLTYTFGMTLAVPCASLFMMYALDRYGRKITSVCAFVAAGLMAIVFANAATDLQLLIAGFIMIFFYSGRRQLDADLRVRGVSQPMRARRDLAGPPASAGSPPLASFRRSSWIQNGWGLTAVFVCLAVVLLIAAVSVTQLGPEAKRRRSRRDSPADGLN